MESPAPRPVEKIFQIAQNLMDGVRRGEHNPNIDESPAARLALSSAQYLPASLIDRESIRSGECREGPLV